MLNRGYRLAPPLLVGNHIVKCSLPIFKLLFRLFYPLKREGKRGLKWSENKKDLSETRLYLINKLQKNQIIFKKYKIQF